MSICRSYSKKIRLEKNLLDDDIFCVVALTMFTLFGSMSNGDMNIIERSCPG